MRDAEGGTSSSAEAWHVGRTLRIIELLSTAPRSAPQLAAAVNAQPRTVRRVLARLVEDDFIRLRDNQRRVYEPTMRLVSLAGQIVDNSLLARSARPYVALLHEQTGATAHVELPSYRGVVCVVHAGSDDADVRPRLREVVPAHCTAGGKAMLAWRDRWRDSVLAAPLERFTERTIVDPVELRRELEEIRLAGQAIEDSEFQNGVAAVASPIVVGDEAIAALTLSGRALDVRAAGPRVDAVARQIADDVARGGDEPGRRS